VSEQGKREMGVRATACSLLSAKAATRLDFAAVVSRYSSPRDLPTKSASDEAWNFRHSRGTVTPAMLPVTVQFLIAMIAHALNERMARRVEYLQEEVRVLKEALAVATGKTRIRFTAEQRRRLAIRGKTLTPAERTACCQVVRPETILIWFRQLAAKKYDSSEVRRKPGRPRKRSDIRELVVKLATETSDGATRRSVTHFVG
jgi:hypothetical protein